VSVFGISLFEKHPLKLLLFFCVFCCTRTDKDILKFQMTEMTNFLPPLNLWGGRRFDLDDWQKRVLTYIDENKSVIVCAPTSSGKTPSTPPPSSIAGPHLFAHALLHDCGLFSPPHYV
jgi:hypothetical protein